MKEVEITIRMAEAAYSELPPQMLALCEAARSATYRSYAPYSHFSVGAAILLSNGEIIEGANQENAAFPSGTCAERSACFYAGAKYPDAKFEAIAIAARAADGLFTLEPTAPCGACRQSLLEYETRAKGPVKVLLCARDKVLIANSITDLLPLSFSEF